MGGKGAIGWRRLETEKTLVEGKEEEEEEEKRKKFLTGLSVCWNKTFHPSMKITKTTKTTKTRHWDQCVHFTAFITASSI